MRHNKLSKDAFEGLLSLQQLDTAARAQKLAETAGRRHYTARAQAVGEKQATGVLAPELAGTVQAQTNLGRVSGGYRAAHGYTAYDYNRGVYVPDCVGYSGIQTARRRVASVFEKLAQRDRSRPYELALSYKHMGNCFDKTVVVIGYIYRSDEMPAALAAQCGRVNVMECLKGNAIAFADLASLPARFDELYRGQPGLRPEGWSGNYYVLRAPLDRPSL